jgi:hypothetical protein
MVFECGDPAYCPSHFKRRNLIIMSRIVKLMIQIYFCILFTTYAAAAGIEKGHNIPWSFFKKLESKRPQWLNGENTRVITPPIKKLLGKKYSDFDRGFQGLSPIQFNQAKFFESGKGKDKIKIQTEPEFAYETGQGADRDAEKYSAFVLFTKDERLLVIIAEFNNKLECFGNTELYDERTIRKAVLEEGFYCDSK